jgi:hypothetical protein
MKTRIVSFIIIIIVSIVSLFFYKGYTDENAIKKARLEQKFKNKAENEANITKMVADYNAIDWENELVEKYKKGSIKLYTHDIQKLWVSGRPILFIGSLKDISEYNDDKYLLRIERFSFARHLPIVLSGHDFELSLTANKSYIDKYLDDNPELRSNKGHKNIAVIADIKSVDTKSVSDDDSTENVFVGNGKLQTIYSFNGSI